MTNFRKRIIINIRLHCKTVIINYDHCKNTLNAKIFF